MCIYQVRNQFTTLGDILLNNGVVVRNTLLWIKNVMALALKKC
jgi:hypothetical protein